nr:MAG TPA: hypothetical protein [Caudoviricetes sp.]
MLYFTTLPQSLTAYPSARLDHLTRWLQQEMALARAEYFSTDCEYQGVQVPFPVVLVEPPR